MPLTGPGAKNAEAERAEDQGGLKRHPERAGDAVERTGVVGVADEGEQREDHADRQRPRGGGPGAS